MATPTVRRTPKQIKRALRERGVTYDDVARLAGVSWTMVWYVVNGQRTSAPVMAAIQKLMGNSDAAA